MHVYMRYIFLAASSCISYHYCLIHTYVHAHSPLLQGQDLTAKDDKKSLGVMISVEEN